MSSISENAVVRQVTTRKHAEARRLYALGFKLCALHHLQKRPVGDGWQVNAIKAIDDDAGGYGMPLALNDLCSLDPDNVEPARAGLARCGWVLDELMDAGVRTSSTRPGSGGRSTFKAPPDLRRIVFRTKRDGTILELRAGQSNLQDCLPGTVYLGKDGDGPYEQQYANGKTLDEAPELPARFIAWWRRMQDDVAFRHEQEALFCGPDVVLSVSSGEGKGVKLAFPSPHRAEFNAHNDVEELLAEHGYTTEGGGRWAPCTATGAPCVRLIPERDGLWQSDHASDPLCGTFDAWTAFVVLGHNGQVSAAEQAWQVQRDKLRAAEFVDARSQLKARIERIEFVEQIAGLPDEAYETLPELAADAKLAGPETDELVRRLNAAAGRDVAKVNALLAQRSRFRVIQASELLGRARSQWHIKGLIPQAELVVMYGASGSGKSFVAWDMVASIARGVDWRGRRVTRGRVVYVVAEGAGGFAKRIEAHAKHHGLDGVDAARVELVVAAPNLLHDSDPAELVREIGAADLIVIDTLAQATPGANENASEDMGAAVARCKRIHEATGATVLLIHHAGKDAAKGARGWSGLRAAADAELEVVRDLKGRRVRLSKSKDGEDGLEWGFALAVVHLGCDEDLEPITSCVVVEVPIAVTSETVRKFTPNQRAVALAVAEVAGTQVDGIPVGAVIKVAAEHMPAPTDGKRDVRRLRAKEALQALCDGDEALYSWGDDDTLTIY